MQRRGKEERCDGSAYHSEGAAKHRPAVEKQRPSAESRRQGKAPHVDSKEACDGSLDAGMQDGRRGRTCERPLDGAVKA